MGYCPEMSKEANLMCQTDIFDFFDFRKDQIIFLIILCL